MCPASRQVVVLPTPPLREMKATLRQPRIGVFTRATSSRRRSSAALGPTRTSPPVRSKTARRQPEAGRLRESRSIRSGEKSAGRWRGAARCSEVAGSSPFRAALRGALGGCCREGPASLVRPQIEAFRIVAVLAS